MYIMYSFLLFDSIKYHFVCDFPFLLLISPSSFSRNMHDANMDNGLYDMRMCQHVPTLPLYIHNPMVSIPFRIIDIFPINSQIGMPFWYCKLNSYRLIIFYFLNVNMEHIARCGNVHVSLYSTQAPTKIIII